MNTSGHRIAGILIPVFSARHENDFGIGDTHSIKEWIDWAARFGVGFIQLLPINENGPEESPYSAISSAALDPIYLALDEQEIPWLTKAEFDNARARVESIRNRDRVEYPQVRATKRTLLELAWSRFDEAPADWVKDFKKFRTKEAEWLDEYCLFRLLMDHHGESLTWDHWPASCQTPSQAHQFLAKLRGIDATSTDYRLGYFAFAQWLCFRQWRSLRAHADRVGVKLMGDVPIGIARHSCDVFFNREDFDVDWCGGSPAEGHGNSFIHQWGQNWGIPLYRWDRMEKNHYRWWHQRITRLTEVFDMFRLDHILGFYRIYAFPWTPEQNDSFVGLSHDQVKARTGGRLPHWFSRPDDTAANQEANLTDGNHRLRAILKAAHGANVIAEDLGWVPGYVRPNLNQIGIAGFRIPHWDCDSSGHPIMGPHYPELSFATYSTHDHEPIHEIWKSCHEVIERESTNPGSYPEWQVSGARNTLQILCYYAGIPIGKDGKFPRFGEAIRLSLIKALFNSRSRYAALTITELFGIPGRINEPGTHQASNWTFRIPWSVSQIEANPYLHDACRKLAITIHLSKRKIE